jgi:alpha-L-fucosidase
MSDANEKEHRMKKGVGYLVAVILGFGLQMAQAATVSRQLVVYFDGSLSAGSYVPASGETMKGSLRLKGGSETLSGGTLSTHGGLEGIQFLPAAGLTSRNSRGEDYLSANFVVEMVARRNAATQGFLQTLLSVNGSVAYRYRGDSATVTEFMTYGPQSTDWRTASGQAAAISDKDQVHYALVYECGGPSQCTLTCYVGGSRVGSSLTNTTAAEGQPGWGMMFGGDCHPSATNRGLPLDIDAVAFSTFTGSFDPASDFALLSRTRLVVDTGDGLTVQEGRAADQYRIGLSRAPLGSVTVHIQDLSDPPQVGLSPSDVTFTPSNWQGLRMVYVTPLAGGHGPSGVRSTTIRNKASSSADAEYNGLAAVDLTVTIHDANYDEASALARPTTDQLLWQDGELGMFIHYSINTYLNQEWDGSASLANLSLFNPANLNTDQWVAAAEAMGARYIVFVAKHVGGFCMWRTTTSQYSIQNTPYKNGQGDVLRDLVASCKARHMRLGVYLSPQDRFLGAGVGGTTFNPADQQRYNTAYRTQLTEVLRDYGPFVEVWFDGSIVTPIADILDRYARDAMIFQCPGGLATIRWVGNENGVCPYPAWNAVSRAAADGGTATAADSDPAGTAWLPIECDTTTRSGWFWSTGNAASLKSLDSLMAAYYQSVGHGAVLLLNMTPDPTGAFPQSDVDRIRQFGQEVQRRFSRPVAQTAGTGSELTLTLSEPSTLNHVVLMEDITQGERIRQYTVDGRVGGLWQQLCSGTAVGHKKIDTFTAVDKVTDVRLRSLRSVGVPIIRQLAVYNTAVTTYDPGQRSSWVVDQWYPGHPATGSDPYVWDIDLTSFIDSPGQFELAFEKTGGDQDIEVQSATLLIDSVEQPNWVTPLAGSHRYRVTISGLGRQITLRAVVYGPSGSRSYGRVTLTR